eukprot:2401331-Amphidinium_carterae.3
MSLKCLPCSELVQHVLLFSAKGKSQDLREHTQRSPFVDGFHSRQSCRNASTPFWPLWCRLASWTEAPDPEVSNDSAPPGSRKSHAHPRMWLYAPPT